MLPPATGRWSVYCDGSISPKVPISPLVDKWLSHYDVAMFKHPHRTCAYKEIDACVTRNKITAKEGEKSRKLLTDSGFPKDFGLWACGVIARRTANNPFQEKVAPFWWQLVKKIPRDQIWLPFAMWKTGFPHDAIYTIDADIFDNPFFSFTRHSA